MGNCITKETEEIVNVPSHQVKVTNKYIINYPDHEKRKNSNIYNKTHYELCIKKNLPCFICGKTRKETNQSLETHHFYIEKAAVNAIDWVKFGQFAKTCYNIQTGDNIAHIFDWEEVAKNPDIFVDSKYNMIVLCKEHHTSGYKGIHHVAFPDWIVQKFTIKNYNYLGK